MDRKMLTGIGALVLIAIVGFVYWQWRQGTHGPLPTPIVERTPLTSTPTPTPSSSPTPVVTIDLSSGNYFFKPNTITVKKGQTVQFNVTNAGLHTFTIDELNVNESLRGSTVTFSITPTKSGSFTFYCSIPGHRERGQVGTLVVTD